MAKEEIKKGDKVRVSKDVPKVYTDGWLCDWINDDSIVKNIDGDSAEIKMNNKGCVMAIPTKYLIKVNDERKEPRFKVGDKVQIKQGLGKFEIATIVYYDSKDNSYRVEFVNEDAVGSLWCAESALYPYTDPTAPTIKVGDKVIYLQDNICGIVSKCFNNHYQIEFKNGLCCLTHRDNVELVQTKEQMEACANGTADSCDIPDVNNHGFDAIKINLEIDIQDDYWEAYSTDLGKGIAIKVSNRYNDTMKAAEYAMQVAKAVVEVLKKK